MTYPLAGSESLCQAQVESVLNGRNVCVTVSKTWNNRM